MSLFAVIKSRSFMNAQQMTSQEMKEAITGLLEWRAEAESRLAENERQLKDLQEWNEAASRFEYVSDDFHDVAWALVTNLLDRDFGMNSSAVWMNCHAQGKEVYLTGAIAYDSHSQRHEACLVRILADIEQSDIDKLTECLRRFHKRTGPHLNDRKVFGLIATTPEIDEEMRVRVLEAGFYLAIVSDKTIRLAVPYDFVPKDFGIVAKKKSKREKYKEKNRS